MKLFSFIVGVLLLSSAAVFAGEQGKSEEVTFWVRGNCGSCEKRIERTLEKIDGVKDAEWDDESGNVTVSFDPAKTNQEAMEKAVAAVGHATKNHKAEKAAHDKLPSCCKEGHEKHHD